MLSGSEVNLLLSNDVIIIITIKVARKSCEMEMKSRSDYTYSAITVKNNSYLQMTSQLPQDEVDNNASPQLKVNLKLDCQQKKKKFEISVCW